MGYRPKPLYSRNACLYVPTTHIRRKRVIFDFLSTMKSLLTDCRTLGSDTSK